MQLLISMLLFAGLSWLISWGMVGILFYPQKPIFGWQAPLIGWARNLNLTHLLSEEKLDTQLDKAVQWLLDALINSPEKLKLSPKIAARKRDLRAQQNPHLFNAKKPTSSAHWSTLFV